jgi:hypothetical protein
MYLNFMGKDVVKETERHRYDTLIVMRSQSNKLADNTAREVAGGTEICGCIPLTVSLLLHTKRNTIWT